MSTGDAYIGLMSGTSVDAIDALVARFDEQGATIIATHSEPPPAALRSALLELSEADRRLSLAEYGQLDQAVGQWFAGAANRAREAAGMTPAEIAAIGSHGQTVWHAPDDAPAFTLQIGSAPRIAAETGCHVVADFRNADIALGGQGAPLACGLHGALLASPSAYRAVINIGGIANVTLLPPGAQADAMQITGFDTGPGNGLMDAWIQRHHDRAYDADGAWADTGSVNTALLSRLLADDYFTRRPPKSTGREYFGLAWLEARLAETRPAPSPADVQATLAELTARSIVDAIATHGPARLDGLYLCGGGVYNRRLVERIGELVAPCPVATTAALGVSPDWVEALAFAWLARRRLHQQPGNAPRVTGASGPAILGGWHAPPAAPLSS